LGGNRPHFALVGIPSLNDFIGARKDHGMGAEPVGICCFVYVPAGLISLTLVLSSR
jgi:hypothetical protein